MFRDLDDVLASNASTYEIKRRLHDVPPHAVWELTVDGSRAVCKLARGPEANPAVEGRVMQYVGRETSVPVPEVLAVGDGYYIAEWCDAAPESGTDQRADPETDPIADLARTLGAGLATLHRETGFDRTGFPRDDGGLVVDDRETWADTLEELLCGWRDYLDEHADAEAVGEVLAFVRAHPSFFEGTDEPALTHGWYTPEHVGIEDGSVACVLDWEHALVAPGEYDYCRTELPFLGPADRERGDGARTTFRAGYESIRPLPDGFDRRRLAYEAVTLAYFLVSGRVQRQRSPEELARLVDRFETGIHTRLTALREELG